jgi:hypothetical protein
MEEVCTRCGAALAEGARFCAACGAAVSHVLPSMQREAAAAFDEIFGAAPGSASL